MTETTVNIPLLRKAVEWAEAEAAKPWELCEWNQQDTIRPPENVLPSFRDLQAGVSVSAQKAAECGTCFCVAGYVVAVIDGPAWRDSRMKRAAEHLGLNDDDAWDLFAANNTIADVRRIAESIAGERL